MGQADRGGVTLTIADQRFEAFCHAHGIAFRRIAEGLQQTPDYELTTSTRSIAVEVKQIDPNMSDQEMLRRLRAGRSAARAVDTARARNPIKEGCRQLRAYTRGNFPGIVLLVDNSGFGADYLEPTSLADCLFGLEQLHFAVSQQPELGADVSGMDHSGGRIFTPAHNTSASAVAALVLTIEGERMALFHNPLAASTLRPDDLMGHGFADYDWGPKAPGCSSIWHLRESGPSA